MHLGNVCVFVRIQQFATWSVRNLLNVTFLGATNLFITCLCVLIARTQKDEKSNPAPPQTTSSKKTDTKSPASQPALMSAPIMLPLNFPANVAAPNLTTVTPQPVIVNNQVLFVRE